jgi:hypothetical protein
MLACPARGLCADMTTHPHRVVAAAQGSPHVKHCGPVVRAPAGPDMQALPPPLGRPSYGAWPRPCPLPFR